MEPMLERALDQAELKMPKSRHMAKVVRLKASIAQTEALCEFLKEELEYLLQGQPLPKKENKRADRLAKLQQYINSKSK
jgi:hypothetical protein